jgi:hypothetical protein
MAAVMIGVDPHKSSHTAVAIGAAEEPLGELRVRASAAQAERLVAWAGAWPERTWAVEGADGVGHLLAQQLLAAGERVLDVQPKLSARVRLLEAGDTNKNDPNDARSVAVAALRSAGCREARRDDHAAVLKLWSKRHRDLGSSRTQVACRLHAVLCELVPGGVSKEITAAQAARILESISPADPVAAARCELAASMPRRSSVNAPAGIISRPATARRRSRCRQGSARSTGCPGAETAASTMSSTWPRSPRSATGTARAAPTTTRSWPRARPAKKPCGR